MIGERLKKVRENLEKSQKEMAKLVGASYRVWQDYEAGNVTPGGKIFEALSNLGYNANWILTGHGIMKINKENELFAVIDNLFGKREVRLLKRVRSLLNEYVNKQSINENIEIDDLSSILFAFIYRKEDSWLSDENINIVINSVINISGEFKLLKSVNMDDKSILEMVGLILDPDKYDFSEEQMDILVDVHKSIKNEVKKDE